MRISELAERSGVPLATVKFYLREGVLQKGRTTSATRAEYDAEHLARLRLVTALAEVGGLPLAKVREILALVDAPLDDAIETMGRAVDALPPYLETDGDLDRARTTIEALGLTFEPRFAATVQLESAVRALEAAGLPWDEATMRRYGEPMLAVARAEIEPVAGMTRAEAVSYAVLGTALYEPVLLALRRLAHHHALVDG